MIMTVMVMASGLAAGPAQAVGRAVVECKVAASGRLTDCVAVSEKPAGANVGAFAVKLAGAFRIPPNDHRVVAGRIRIPMRFKLPGAAP
jgi:TonB family protein